MTKDSEFVVNHMGLGIFIIEPHLFFNVDNSIPYVQALKKIWWAPKI